MCCCISCSPQSTGLRGVVRLEARALSHDSLYKRAWFSCCSVLIITNPRQVNTIISEPSLQSNTSSSGVVVMVKYCGYTVRNEWMYQRGVDLGFPRPVTAEEKSDMILRISRDLMTETGVSRCTKLRHVKTAKGIGFWCIAFASNDTLSERLPTTAPSEEKYKALKEMLQKKGPPRWYKAS